MGELTAEGSDGRCVVRGTRWVSVHEPHFALIQQCARNHCVSIARTSMALSTTGPQWQLIAVGNPGSGKSSLLNCLLQKYRFKSGSSLGNGLTQNLDTCVVGNVALSDTPGLADVDYRVSAASAITQALRQGGNVKLMAVIKCVGLRVSPEDIATIKHVLDAVKGIGVETKSKYVVIVNQVTPRELREYTKEEICAEVRTKLPTDHPTSFLHVVPRDTGFEDGDIVVLPKNVELVAFLLAGPKVLMCPGNAATVNAEGYDELVNKLRAMASEMIRVNKLLADAQEREVAAAETDRRLVKQQLASMRVTAEEPSTGQSFMRGAAAGTGVVAGFKAAALTAAFCVIQ